MQLSVKVHRVLVGENISMEELHLMVEHSALTSTHEGFNRRYHHWLFEVVDGSVLNMRYTETSKIGTGQYPQTEEHLDCGGAGCKGCGWAGEVIRMVSDKPPTKHTPLFLPRSGPR